MKGKQTHKQEILTGQTRNESIKGDNNAQEHKTEGTGILLEPYDT